MNIDNFAESIIRLSHQLHGRTIHGEHGPYLTRYTVSDLPLGDHIYLHRFHRSDADRDLHSHPWGGSSLILRGGYSEERRVDGGPEINRRSFRASDVNILTPDTFHRVDLLDGESWSLFTTTSRCADWSFWDRDTGIETPWREALARRGLL